MTSILLADDQELVRAGLRMILSIEPDLDVVGEAGDGVQAVAEARRLRPHIVLMDIRMPIVDGIEATRRLAAMLPETRVVMLTTRPPMKPTVSRARRNVSTLPLSGNDSRRCGRPRCACTLR